jgi:hypothetical protein
VELRVQVHVTGLVAGDGLVSGRIDAPGVDDGPLQEPPSAEFVVVGEPLFRGQRLVDPDPGRGSGGIHDRVNPVLDSVDDPGVDVRVVVFFVRLRIEGMDVHDRRTGLGARDALLDAFLDGGRRSRLSVFPPATVYRRLDSRLRHG